MDINEQLQSIVSGLVGDLKVKLEEEIRGKVTEEVIQKVASEELNATISQIIQQQLEARLERINLAETSKTHLDRIVSTITKNLNVTLVEQARNEISGEISRKLGQIDVNMVVGEIVKQKLESIVKLHSFPERSIPHRSIILDGLKLSGEFIKGGIIEEFGSTGIEDLATKVQMTVLDQAVTFETALWAPEVKVKGNMTVDGDLIIKGEIPTDSPAFAKLTEYSARKTVESLNTHLFESFSDIIFNKIKNEGIDLDIIKQQGKEVVAGNQLGYHIVDTNIQRVGLVRDFNSVGDTYLSQTLYVSGNRVGVNTIDPSAALSVWDQECEVNINKRQQDVGYIGTPRRQELILGANNKENIRLDVEGATHVNRLVVNNTPMSSLPAVPNTQGERGEIYWNEDPDLGDFIGWVCLGGTRWAGFGRIE